MKPFVQLVHSHHVADLRIFIRFCSVEHFACRTDDCYDDNDGDDDDDYDDYDYDDDNDDGVNIFI